MTSHPNYDRDYADFFNFGYNMNFFAGYFTAKLQNEKFVEIMKIREKLFKIECLRYRGYKITEADDLRVMGFFDDGSKNVISVVNTLINSSAKDYLSQKDLNNLQDTLTAAKDYVSLNIKFNLSQKEEALFRNIRKALRDKLLSDNLTVYEKAFIRKIVNDIQSLIKFEFSSVKCIEDHKSSLTHKLSNFSDENNAKKIKLNRITAEKTDIIKDIKCEAIIPEEGKICDDDVIICENLTTTKIEIE